LNSDVEVSVAKQRARVQLKDIRAGLSPSRRKQAQEALEAELYRKLSTYSAILSFYSLPEEIDTSGLNQKLALEGRLYLPRVEGMQLHFYHVTDLKAQLTQTGSYLFEPDNEKCMRCDPYQLDCALIPGLGFDLENYRLGYGKGYYDRLLEGEGERFFSVGIAFYEQLALEALPRETHDKPVKALFLV